MNLLGIEKNRINFTYKLYYSQRELMFSIYFLICHFYFLLFMHESHLLILLCYSCLLGLNYKCGFASISRYSYVPDSYSENLLLKHLYLPPNKQYL